MTTKGSIKLPQINNEDVVFSNNIRLGLVSTKPGATVCLDLGKLLLQNLNVTSYKLTHEQKQWIQTFLEGIPKDTFDQLITDINTINNKDGTSNIKDIPKIISLLKDLYVTISKNKTQIVTREKIIHLIEYTIDVLIDTNNILLPNDYEKDEVIEFVHILLDFLNKVNFNDFVTKADKDCIKSKCWVSFTSIFKGSSCCICNCKNPFQLPAFG
jgi:hypothetical protein